MSFLLIRVNRESFQFRLIERTWEDDEEVLREVRVTVSITIDSLNKKVLNSEGKWINSYELAHVMIDRALINRRSMFWEMLPIYYIQKSISYSQAGEALEKFLRKNKTKATMENMMIAAAKEAGYKLVSK